MAGPILVERRVKRLRAISEARAALREGRFRDLREPHGLSQRELARALDVDESAVSRWESGARVPREEAAERISALLRALDDPSESATPAVAGEVAPRDQPSDGRRYHRPTRATG
jgi:transcriptional regulator with XRE-family HTH domain